MIAPGSQPAAKEAPQSLEVVRETVHPGRWALYSGVRDILNEIANKIEWSRLYTTDDPLPVYLEWGLFLEQLIPGVHDRVRSRLPDAAGADAEVLAELEDDVSWSLGRFEDALRQPLTILRTTMLTAVTARRQEFPEEEVALIRERLCSSIADVYGRMRSDLRRFSSFVVAEDRWDLAMLETVLFPERRRELEQGKGLKEGLARLMEAFRGTTERVPLADVFKMWVGGEILAVHGIAELERAIRELGDLLDEEDRVALYVSDYLRLRHWEAFLRDRFENLRGDLGDRGRELVWLKEMAAYLDSEILAWMLGQEGLRGYRFPRDSERVCHHVVRKGLKRAGFEEHEVDRLVDFKERLARAAEPETVPLAEEDKELLARVVVHREGGKALDRLRNKLALPDSMRHLEHLHPVVLDVEDGLKTFLLLLYGQVQQRDLRVLERGKEDISLGEKLLALQELEYRLERIEASVEFAALEAVRDLFVGQGRDVPPRVWGNVRNLLSRVVRELVPRLERVAGFRELEGLEEGAVDLLLERCQELCGLATVGREDLEDVGRSLRLVTAQLEGIVKLRINVAPPHEMPDIEQYLETLG